MPFGDGTHDLLVVGAGQLGESAARQWQQLHPSSKIACVTWSDAKHPTFTAAGFIPFLASQPLPSAPYVLFSAPPSRRQSDEDFLAAIRRAGAAATRRMVFTSATSVYVESDAQVVREDSPLADTPRARRMLVAEEAARSSRASDGVAAVRLGLLYSRDRGIHELYIRKLGELTTASGTVFNCVHYDDAAGAAVAALLAPRESGTAFIVVDGVPTSPEVMVKAALAHPMYEGCTPPKDGPPGEVRFKKIVDGRRSWDLLSWRPKWTSFEHFFQSDAKAVRENALLTETVTR